MRKILVLRGGALGDFVVTLPAIALLRAHWPAARIELVGHAAAELAVARGLIDAAHSQHEARWSVLFGDAPLAAAFATWLAGFDLVLNFWPNPDGELHRRFPLHIGQRFLTASALPNIAPAAAHYCAALAPLDIATQDYFHSLATHRESDLGPHPLIAVHPGSGSPRKNWPLDRWKELCRRLRHEHRADLLIVTGEAESADTLAGLGTAARNLPLEKLVARLAECRLFLGHDSGVGHLAAACGVPCILLFGPTDPAMWAPPAPHVQVIKRSPDLASISVEEVEAAAAARTNARTSLS